jgi:tetratricopeptide (TPR) repeat protein
MSEELKQLEIKAENGDVDSQMRLGDHFRFKENDFEKAIKYYSMAAKQGNIKAYVHLAMYYSSKGDSKKSKEYYLKAAEGGNAEAQCILGFIYYEDESNNEEAFKWFKLAADNGDADAQYEVAEFYYMGRVEKNWKEAARYCRMAAEQGHEKAMSKLDGFEAGERIAERGGGGCYIATMVYGSYDAPEVMIFRRFRDEVLKKSVVGRIFIRVYYATSPSFVKIFKNSKVVNNMIKAVLDKVLEKIEKE